MRPSRHRAPAFATLVAIIMVALVGSASLSLLILMRDQAAQTAPAADDAQLRQMLAAGGVAGVQMLPPPGAATSGAAQTLDLPLPVNLAERGAKVSMRSEPGPGGGSVSWFIHVEATLGERKARQALKFARTFEGWVAAEAVVGGRG